MTASRAAPKPRPKIPEPINPPKKGRNKLVLVGVAVVVLAGVAYGAGLLLDHADVPNGTTALGVDIGGTTREDAVKKLETALKGRRATPLKLTVDGKAATLEPDKAGLDIDPQATVRKAAGRDYNPVSVIGSLFGGTRTAEPEVVVDDEKLQIALANVAGPSGAAKDGGITFENGKAVPHYGVPHKAIDVKASKKKVTDAYRNRATTGADAPVVLAASTQQPQVDKAAVDKALEQFAKPAMSGLVTVRTDAAHTVSFSPQKSIPKFLSFKIVDGGLVPYYDRPALKELYGRHLQRRHGDQGRRLQAPGQRRGGGERGRQGPARHRSGGAGPDHRHERQLTATRRETAGKRPPQGDFSAHPEKSPRGPHP